MIRLERLIAPVVVLVLTCLPVLADTVWLVPEVYLFDTSGQATNLTFKAVRTFDVTGNRIAISSDGTPSAECSHERYKPTLHYGLSSRYLFSELTPPVSELATETDPLVPQISEGKVTAKFYSQEVFDEYRNTSLQRPLEFRPPVGNAPLFRALLDAVDSQSTISGDLEFRVDSPGLALFATSPDPLLPAVFHSAPFNFISTRNRLTEYATDVLAKKTVWWQPQTWNMERIFWVLAMGAGLWAIVYLARRWVRENEEVTELKSAVVSESAHRVVVRNPVMPAQGKGAPPRKGPAIIPREENWRIVPPLEIPAPPKLSVSSAGEEGPSAQLELQQQVGQTLDSRDDDTSQSAAAQIAQSLTQDTLPRVTVKLAAPDKEAAKPAEPLPSAPVTPVSFQASGVDSEPASLSLNKPVVSIPPDSVEHSLNSVATDSAAESVTEELPNAESLAVASVAVPVRPAVNAEIPVALPRESAYRNGNSSHPDVQQRETLPLSVPPVMISAEPERAAVSVNSTSLLQDDEFRDDEIITASELLFHAAQLSQTLPLSASFAEDGEPMTDSEDELELFNDNAPLITASGPGTQIAPESLVRGLPVEESLWLAPEHETDGPVSMPADERVERETKTVVLAPLTAAASAGAGLRGKTPPPVKSTPAENQAGAEKRADALVTWLQHDHPEMMEAIPVITYQSEEFRGLPFAIALQDDNVLDLDDYIN